MKSTEIQKSNADLGDAQSIIYQKPRNLLRNMNLGLTWPVVFGHLFQPLNKPNLLRLWSTSVQQQIAELMKNADFHSLLLKIFPFKARFSSVSSTALTSFKFIAKLD